MGFTCAEIVRLAENSVRQDNASVISDLRFYTSDFERFRKTICNDCGIKDCPVVNIFRTNKPTNNPVPTIFMHNNGKGADIELVFRAKDIQELNELKARATCTRAKVF